MEEFTTVYLPKPGNACLEQHGCRLVTPSGESLPGISNIQISAPAGELVEVTVKMLARVEQAEG